MGDCSVWGEPTGQDNFCMVRDTKESSIEDNMNEVKEPQIEANYQ
jgi:hypothetical protein